MENAKYGKMRQVTAVNGSKMVVKLRGGLLPSGEGVEGRQTGSCRKKYALLFVKPLNGSALYRLFRQSAHTAERFCLLLVANQHNELIDQQGCIADQCSD